MSNKINLNVGGTQFVTTLTTLEKCHRFRDNVLKSSKEDIFLDRDPHIFNKALKIMRGYPCEDAAGDLDVISELAWLEHNFLEEDLPNWLEAAVQDIENTNHILDPEQTRRFSCNCVLASAEAITKLGDLLLLGKDYQKCRVVGVRDGWVESQWVPIHDFKLAKLKYRFIKHFLPHYLI
jgi:hypothetical protein